MQWYVLLCHVALYVMTGKEHAWEFTTGVQSSTTLVEWAYAFTTGVFGSTQGAAYGPGGRRREEDDIGIYQ